MLIHSIELCNKLGLHTRASMQLINTAGRFASDIRIGYKEQWVDAKDILSVMALGARYQSSIEIKAMGEDEAEAIAALITLVQNRFGEDE